MSASTRGSSKSFSTPDERVTKGGVEVEVLQLGDMKVKRATYPPGWKFSTHMGAAQCLDTHVGYAVSGRLSAEFGDGTRLDIGPGSAFVIPSGHDAWVTGDEPFVIVQFDEGESAARRFNVEGGATKAA